MRIKGMQLASFANAYLAGRRSVPHPTHVFVCVADHFEPDWNGANREHQQQRVDRWLSEYPKVVDGCEDSRGRPPQHTFFTPIECYCEAQVEALAKLIRAGYGDVEVHLHHDDDDSDSLRAFLLSSIETLHSRHGLLNKDAFGKIRYGFIHGNWALDNSHPEGRHCGVNDELTVLRETGCYADFTMPAAPHAAQTRTINRLYYAIDDPDRPKSHDTGIPVAVGKSRPQDGLLMIQGPLVVTHKKLWQKPRIENGNVAGSQPLLASRMEDWLRAGVCVAGQPQWLFVKLHTHGAPEKNADGWLSDQAKTFHQGLRQTAQRYGFCYHYVTACEMAQLVGQAEQGLTEPLFDLLEAKSLVF